LDYENRKIKNFSLVFILVMNKLVKSAGGIIYYYDENNDIRFLLIKRHALSGKIERVAPKGKIQI